MDNFLLKKGGSQSITLWYINRLVKEVLSSRNQCFYSTVTNPLPNYYFRSAHVFQFVSKEIQVYNLEVKLEVYAPILQAGVLLLSAFCFHWLNLLIFVTQNILKQVPRG